MKTESVTKTVKLPLRQPSQRKQERIEHCRQETERIAQGITELMPSLPVYRWGGSTKDSAYFRWVKENFPNHDLRSHDACEVAYKVAASFKTYDKNGRHGKEPSFSEVSWIRFRNPKRSRYEYNEGDWGVKLPLEPYNPEWFNIRHGEYQAQILRGLVDDNMKEGSAELHIEGGGYIVHQSYTQKTEVYEDDEVETLVGVDVGLTNIAVASAVNKEHSAVEAVEVFNGAEIAHHRSRLYKKRKEYQEKHITEKFIETKNQESSFVNNHLHTVSRRIIDLAEDNSPAKILLEDLSGYRDRLLEQEKEYAPETRRILHNWPFRKLQDMIEYKARESGIPVEYVDPRMTSQICNKCGHKGKRNQSTFYCENCDYEVNADVNAAINIASS